ncbi:MAG: NAD-dependent epimerase/dehydratase family protein, partial [Actinomycetota bacterium]|nr:NAD-dependent epimerase/dehydratase family protein [Actinomycetota bacterium]
MNAFLVTGCAGFIGSHLVERLLASDFTVVGLDAYTDYYSRDLKEQNLAYARRHPRFSLVEGDILEVDLAHLVSRVDAVFHLAAQAGVRGSWGDSFATYARNNLVATQRLFEAAANARVRVVWASSSSVYGDAETYPTREDGPLRPVSPYGVTKLACEQLAATYARSFDLDEVALRYFTVYGPRQRPDMAFTRITRALWTGEVFRLYGTGEQSRDVTYAEDAVTAAIAAMEAAP